MAGHRAVSLVSSWKCSQLSGNEDRLLCYYVTPLDINIIRLLQGVPEKRSLALKGNYWDK